MGKVHWGGVWCGRGLSRSLGKHRGHKGRELCQKDHPVREGRVGRKRTGRLLGARREEKRTRRLSYSPMIELLKILLEKPRRERRKRSDWEGIRGKCVDNGTNRVAGSGNKIETINQTP